MKVFHFESVNNNMSQEVVYIQLRDIIYLLSSDINIPVSIKEEFLSIGADYLRSFNDYFRFESPDVVEFFKSLPFIVDYNLYKDMSVEEIAEEFNKVVKKGNSLASKWNSMSKEERIENPQVLSEYKNTTYTYSVFSELQTARITGNQVQLPVYKKQFPWE